ncbi:unnamed protein product [Owenia fusiformis]|uniref:Uncharacterized protein n=1 Tax=Owenia fusiformis TaxID=6347 RepID=A0A8S4PYN3_OWEFU|nr:unnamed protein product [Owenia fusiformis]
MHSLANKSIFASTTILNLMILASCIVTGSSRHITNNEGRPSDILNTYDVGDSLLWKMLSAGLVEYSPGFTVNSRIAQSNEDAMDANKLDTFQKRRDDHAKRDMHEACCRNVMDACSMHKWGHGCIEALQGRMCGSMGLCQNK